MRKPVEHLLHRSARNSCFGFHPTLQRAPGERLVRRYARDVTIPSRGPNLSVECRGLEMNIERVRQKAKWVGLATGLAFLGISTYMRVTYVFESGNTGGLLLLLALTAALITLVLGVISLPRWQGFVSLAICVYAIHWISGPTYAIP
jgi:hypothetical protein